MNLYALVFGESVLNDAVSLVAWYSCFMFSTAYAAHAQYLMGDMVLYVDGNIFIQVCLILPLVLCD